VDVSASVSATSGSETSGSEIRPNASTCSLQSLNSETDELLSELLMSPMLVSSPQFLKLMESPMLKSQDLAQDLMRRVIESTTKEPTKEPSHPNGAEHPPPSPSRSGRTAEGTAKSASGAPVDTLRLSGRAEPVFKRVHSGSAADVLGRAGLGSDLARGHGAAGGTAAWVSAMSV